MSKLLSSLPAGSLVRDADTKYYDAAIVWKIGKHNYPASGQTKLVSDKTLCWKAFDAKEPNNTDTDRKSYGNNRYLYSNIFQWLNKGGTSWYTAQHQYDQSPDSTSVVSTHPYSTEIGFFDGITNFKSNKFLGLLKKQTLTIAKPNVDGGGSENVTAYFQFLTDTEVGYGTVSGVSEGSQLDIFTNDTSRIAYPTAESVSKDANGSVTSSTMYWLASSVYSFSYLAEAVNSIGSHDHTLAYSGNVAVRPTCVITSNAKVSDTPDANGVYDIVYNTPPVISTPSTSLGDKNQGFNITFFIADADSNTCTATVSIDGTAKQAYPSITLGATNIFTVTMDMIKALSIATHTITISANDGTETVTKDITFNRVASSVLISGSDGSLGNRWLQPTITYSLYETESKTISTVVEAIDGKTTRTLTSSHIVSQITFDMSTWSTLSDEANHTLTITATNSDGNSSKRTWTLQKLYSSLILVSPVQTTDAMAENIIVDMLNQGGTVKVEATNDANDTVPLWEDMTTEYNAGSSHKFANANKTATQWGVAVRITLTKTADTERVYLKGYSYSFS